jgi:hypothetical protein
VRRDRPESGRRAAGDGCAGALDAGAVIAAGATKLSFFGRGARRGARFTAGFGVGASSVIGRLGIIHLNADISHFLFTINA